eukprot:20045_5
MTAKLKRPRKVPRRLHPTRQRSTRRRPLDARFRRGCNLRTKWKMSELRSRSLSCGTTCGTSCRRGKRTSPGLSVPPVKLV